ncbi:DUF3089 domain-containing protein [Desulfonatronum sp. SC1]|uniref:DUF3089 domain-containing protein n=1 Tax=Desulfonatronum sp. SC1 TaxID=2109626 RepID=UPI000D30709D|nr:DUF3089 domain-containing protein [Desulfonatronum sp. SC1]PTN38260.1 hypothetical protein C6366_03330 [Desulfonatronum sp. SC1]
MKIMKIWIKTIIMLVVLNSLIALNASSNETGANKYSISTNWQTLPKNASHAVDVFFLYPTTYFPDIKSNSSVYSPIWNQTIGQAQADPSISTQVASKSSVFHKAGTNLYVPYFQQAAGFNVLEALLWKTNEANRAAATMALEIAYRDVEDAFDYFLSHYNKDAKNNPRPFILAGHSQGSNLLLMLLQRRFSDATLRERLVAAYVIGWSITADDISNYPALSQLGICSSRVQTGCIITYNTQQNPGDFSQTGPSPTGIVQANAYSVNPLTWAASGPNEMETTAVPATENLGALFYKFQPPVNPQLGPPPGGRLAEGQVWPTWKKYLIGGVDVDAVVIANFTGAQNNQGALVIDPTALPKPGNYQNLNAPYNLLPGWYHNYDYSFFFFNLELNVIDRIASYYIGRYEVATKKWTVY